MELIETTCNWMVALGKTLIHTIWIGLLYLSLLRVLFHILPAASSLWRYRISYAILLLFFLTSILLFTLFFSPVKTPGTQPSIFAWSVQAHNQGRLWLWSSYIYFAGVSIFMVRNMVSAGKLLRLERKSIPVNREWQAILCRIKKKIGINRAIRFLSCPSVTVPSVTGLIKPAVIVPAGMLTGLSIDQIELILMHELYHIKRLDFLANIVQILLEDLFFYHPAVRTISDIIRTERERCCDDLVIQNSGKPLIYARALVNLAEQDNAFSRLVPAAGGGGGRQLFNRIERIINHHHMKRSIFERIQTLVLIAVSVVILLTITGFSLGFSVFGGHSQPPPDRKYPVIGNIAELKEANTLEDSVGKHSDPQVIKIKKEIPLEIDCEEIRKELKNAIQEMEDIDWDKINEEIKNATKEMEESLKEVEEIDWEMLHQELERTSKAIDEINLEQILKEIEQAIEKI